MFWQPADPNTFARSRSQDNYPNRSWQCSPLSASQWALKNKYIYIYIYINVDNKLHIRVYINNCQLHSSYTVPSQTFSSIKSGTWKQCTPNGGWESSFVLAARLFNLDYSPLSLISCRKFPIVICPPTSKKKHLATMNYCECNTNKKIQVVSKSSNSD